MTHRWDQQIPKESDDVVGLLRRRIEVHAWWRDHCKEGSKEARLSEKHGVGSADSHQTYINQYEAAIRIIEAIDANARAEERERRINAAEYHTPLKGGALYGYIVGAAMHMPWGDPAFRSAVRMREQGERFLRACKKAEAAGRKLTPNQKHLKALFSGKSRG